MAFFRLTIYFGTTIDNKNMYHKNDCIKRIKSFWDRKCDNDDDKKKAKQNKIKMKCLLHQATGCCCWYGVFFITFKWWFHCRIKSIQKLKYNKGKRKRILHQVFFNICVIESNKAKMFQSISQTQVLDISFFFLWIKIFNFCRIWLAFFPLWLKQ